MHLDEQQQGSAKQAADPPIAADRPAQPSRVCYLAEPSADGRRGRLFVLISLGFLVSANAVAVVRLMMLVLNAGDVNHRALSADRLLIAGSLVLVTNIVSFALLYWQMDGGGPRGRRRLSGPFPDFQFPQTLTSGLAAPGWRPRFGDHLYLAFTNVVAFSAAETVPLTLRAKGLMALQSILSLGVILIVVARMINLLPG
jgi:uncharacterized membrane protein